MSFSAKNFFLSALLFSAISWKVAFASVFDVLAQATLTEVDSSYRNSGIFIADEAQNAPIRVAPTADKKGAHFAAAAAGIASSSPSSAQTLSTLSTLSASNPSLQPSSSTGQSTATQALSTSLSYQNGTVMSQTQSDGPFQIYLIFYGLWKQSEISVVKNFIDSIKPATKPSSPSDRVVYNWWQVTAANYHDANGNPIVSDVRFAGVALDPNSAYPLGGPDRPLMDRDIKNIVSRAINNKFGTPSSRSAYFVLTDKNTYVTNFGTGACSYHSAYRSFGKTIAYAHVGDPSIICPSTCSYSFFNPSAAFPNSLGIDSVVNGLAHELINIATNPFQFFKRGNAGWVVANSTLEPGSFCELDFGYVLQNPQGASYNLQGSNGVSYLVQRAWNRKSGRCKINADNNEDSST